MTLDRGRLIIGISGSSGVVYGVRLLEALAALPIQSHLIMTKPAEMTLGLETDHKIADVRAWRTSTIRSTMSAPRPHRDLSPRSA